MSRIAPLSQETIDKIAAGEVVERPSSVVKELVENSIDANASAITVEIKDGGISMIRITDNGEGIEKDQVPLAFLRHSTSKIKSVEDLLSVSSLGFRGEALSSIAAVSQVELITKTIAGFTGTRYVIEGSKEISFEEIGAPEGTTFIVRNLFYNTPARRKFLKTPQTEGGYIHALTQRLALSHPEISFKLIINNQTKLHTSGNNNPKDAIYQIYGREVTASLLEINQENSLFSVTGYIGKPEVSRGNRDFENYFINHRYIKSSLVAKSIEDAYKNFLMQHQYPFCVLYFTFEGEMLDVNVHPTKMELRFSQNEGIYQALYDCIRERLLNREHIRNISLEETKGKTEEKPEKPKERPPEPFEKKRLMQEKVKEITASIKKDSPYERKYREEQKPIDVPLKKQDVQYVQEEILYEEKFLSEHSKKFHKVIGQVFDTYWLVEFDGKLFIIDQHAAHEKVLYEKTLKILREKTFTSQMVSPPLVVSLDIREETALKEFERQLTDFGFDIRHFGGREYAISGVPGNLYSLDAKQVLLEILDGAGELHKSETPELVLEKIASMSCKAAVKGNHSLSFQEAKNLIEELLELENPYFCPHGRPTIISMTKYELEKKFRRIV
ncbi:MAG: DNA mismatch repair endonuclease MutL [Lachnospiraceae bacterium]|nr:DNA mismatch repair endonuclease MutL [Lachnospiraceae bacterium]